MYKKNKKAIERLMLLLVIFLVLGKLILKIFWKNFYIELVVVFIDGFYVLVVLNVGEFCIMYIFLIEKIFLIFFYLNMLVRNF